jgi:cob(I)alamin adenosyltransferase
MARAVCRRLERSLVALSAEKALRSEPLVFVNRLSDWLFCAARYANHEAGVEDAAWTGDR